jgi:hypothetical protein
MTIAKVSSGQPLKIPAAAFNAFVEAANAHQNSQHAQSSDARSTPVAVGMISVRNDTGAPRDRFTIVGIDSPVISPTDNPLSWQDHLVFLGASAQTEAHKNRYGILQEPLAAGAIGRALVSGVSIARIFVKDVVHDHARIAAGTLETAQSGSAQIIWKEPGLGDRWGVVRIPVESSSGGPGVMARTSVWANATGQIADGAALAATQDNQVLLRVSGKLTWLTAESDSVLRLSPFGLGFGKINSAYVDSGQTQEGYVFTVSQTGTAEFSRNLTLGQGWGKLTSTPGRLTVTLNAVGDYASITNNGIELFRRSVSTIPMVKIDLNSYSAWSNFRTMSIREIDICDGGRPKKMLVLASPPF